MEFVDEKWWDRGSDSLAVKAKIHYKDGPIIVDWIPADDSLELHPYHRRTLLFKDGPLCFPGLSSLR